MVGSEEEGASLSYKVLNLKWRPKTFAELQGQKPVQQILTQALQSDSVFPALIFSGPKGTGKTSTARILAKSLICQNKNSFEPCNTCSSCQSIQEGKDMDVIEIDGASNNGVDAIRDLKNSVHYMPVGGKKRIYIIDEVHMLSQSAFNALLKTLEEPPSHIHFIMATTELKKIPQTVSSRCQIFHFKPLSLDIIKQRLEKITSSEKIQIDEEALWLIAEQSSHSMRDAQVLLDQMACFNNKKISSQAIIDVLGLSQRSLINSVLKALIQKDTQSILSFMEEISSSNPQTFLKTLLIQMRNLLMIKLVSDSSKWVFLSDSEKEFLENLKDNVSCEEIHFLFDMCLKGLSDLSQSFDPKIALEMVLLRMSQSEKLETLLSREPFFPSGEKKENPSIEKNKTDKDSKKHSIHHSNGKNNLNFPEKKIKEKASKDVEQEVDKKWSFFIDYVQKKDFQFCSQIKHFSVYKFSETEVILGSPPSALFLKDKIKNPKFQKCLKEYLSDCFKKDIKYQFTESSSESFRKKEFEKTGKNKLREIKEAESHPAAQKISRLLQAQIISVDKKEFH